MNNCQLASSGLAFTNSNSIVQGNFFKPDTVLDTIRMSKPTAAGVIAITGKHASGRIGVSNNCVIVGAVVDGSGETGIGAVYKLLLVPHGTFNFRQLLPQEQWHLQQDLNLHVHEVKTSLAGPSSIGLARPADTSLTDLPAVTPIANTPTSNFPVSNTVSETSVRPSNLSIANSNEGMLMASSTTIINNAVAPGKRNDDVYEEYVQSRRTIKINNYEQTVTSTFVADCNKLLNSIEKKQTAEISRPLKSARTTDPNLKALARTTDPKLRALTVVAEPTSDQSTTKSRALLPAVIIAGVMGFIGLVGFASHSVKPASSVKSINNTAEFMATANAESKPTSTAEDLRITSKSDNYPAFQGTVTKQSPIFSIANSESEQPGPDHTTFILPGAGPIHSSAPPLSSSQTAETSTASNTTLDGLLVKSKVETENMSFWVQAVKKNPNDAIAREHLAYKLLASGQPKVSVQQFQALMVLRHPSTEEIEKYVDALVLYNQKSLAQQFLTYVLTADPSQAALRQKLESIQ